MYTKMKWHSSSRRSFVSPLRPPFILRCNTLTALSFNSLSNYLLYSYPTEILLSECWTELRNKLFYVRCTKELIIAQWFYIVAGLHSGKLTIERRDLMMRTARADCPGPIPGQWVPQTIPLTFLQMGQVPFCSVIIQTHTRRDSQSLFVCNKNGLLCSIFLPH